MGEVGESGGSRKSIKLGVVKGYLLSPGSIKSLNTSVLQ